MYAVRYTYYQYYLTPVLHFNTAPPGAMQPCSHDIGDPLSITHLPPAHQRLIDTHINNHPPYSLPPRCDITDPPHQPNHGAHVFPAIGGF